MPKSVFRFAKIMRRAVGAAVVAGLLLPVAACGDAAGQASQDSRPVVLTTFTVLADMAQNVAGDKLRVESITKVGAEIHGYEPTPGDIRRAATRTSSWTTDSNLEAWFAQFVDGLDVPHAVVSDGIEVMQIAEDAYAGQAEPARLDVPGERPDLRGQHGHGVFRA